MARISSSAFVISRNSNRPDRKRSGLDSCNAVSYVPSHRSFPGGLRRGGLLAVVLALHGVAFAAILTVGTVMPELPETPLMVHFIDPPKPVELAPPVAQPLPVAAPEPVAEPPPPPLKPPEPKPVPKPVPRPAPKPKPVPKPIPQPIPQAAPPLETTSSSEPAPVNAAIMVAAEPTPAAAREDTDATTDAAARASQGSGAGPIGARFNAGYLNNPAPPYPPRSRRLGEEGRVVLRVLVSQEGLAQQVELDTSSGSSRLDESALDTVRKWRFIPASRGGEAIESWVLIPILFRLEQ
jgi:protein TonB